MNNTTRNHHHAVHRLPQSTAPSHPHHRPPRRPSPLQSPSLCPLHNHCSPLRQSNPPTIYQRQQRQLLDRQANAQLLYPRSPSRGLSTRDNYCVACWRWRSQYGKNHGPCCFLLHGAPAANASSTNRTLMSPAAKTYTSLPPTVPSVSLNPTLKEEKMALQRISATPTARTVAQENSVSLDSMLLASWHVPHSMVPRRGRFLLLCPTLAIKMCREGT